MHAIKLLFDSNSKNAQAKFEHRYFKKNGWCANASLQYDGWFMSKQMATDSMYNLNTTQSHLTDNKFIGLERWIA